MQFHACMVLFLGYNPKSAILFAPMPSACYPGFVHSMHLTSVVAWHCLTFLKYIFIPNGYSRLLNGSSLKESDLSLTPQMSAADRRMPPASPGFLS